MRVTLGVLVGVLPFLLGFFRSVFFLVLHPLYRLQPLRELHDRLLLVTRALYEVLDPSVEAQPVLEDDLRLGDASSVPWAWSIRLRRSPNRHDAERLDPIPADLLHQILQYRDSR